ncbi:MAG TPA: GntR family transcriptional regulator [Streptomyces sp.]|nr:GntR family transcriptional regulator [Streptomyces sp.]
METRKGYSDVAAHYRDRITVGDLRPDDPMPTVNEVAQEHGVARNTAARAYDLLKREGYITTRAGAGTFVAKRPGIVVTGADRLDRLNRTGRRYAPGEESTGHRVMRRSCADMDICRALDIDPGEEVIIRIRTFRQDGKPTSVGVSVIHPRAAADVPEVQEPGPAPKFWQHIYTERTGREIVKGQRTAQARQASQDELDALEIDAPPHVAVAVLVTNVTFHDDAGPIEHWEDVYAPGTKMDVRD